MASRPDHGISWIVALACFFINFIMAGLARTAGVLFVALIDLFNISREEATTPFSIRVCIRNMTGPLIGFLGLRYGVRMMTTVGAFVAAVGSIMCCFAPNIFWITIFWGVIHGIGFGLSTVLHMLILCQYFDKYKASALGLGYSGDCFGSFVFPIVMEFLFTKYGIRGTFLILGGIILNVIPMGLLLRKPPWVKAERKRKRLKKDENESKNDLKMENSNDSQRNKRVNNGFERHNVDVASLNKINSSKISRKNEIDDTPFYENVSNAASFSNIKRHFAGHFNPAFQSSTSDISSSNEPIEIKCSNTITSNNFLVDQETKSSSLTPSPNMKALSSLRNKSFLSLDLHSSSNSSINICKTCKRPNDPEIRTSRSVSDVALKNEGASHVNRSPWLNKMQERRESLPPVFERETSLKNQQIKSRPNEDTNREYDSSSEIEANRVDGFESLKRRTSSFVGQVAHEIVNKMRTASFASQVAQDAFIAPISQDVESDSEQELPCELKSIVKHKNHDLDHCTNQDIILSVEKGMTKDYETDIPCDEKSESKTKSQVPSVLKVMINTNTKPMFILISLSMAVYCFMFVSVLTVIIDYAVDHGVTHDQGKYLIIGLSVADLFGRLSFGQVIDRNYMKIKNFSGCSMLITGSFVVVIPLNVSFNYMMVCMCLYGFAQGGIAIMFPILVSTYMDKHSESVAMGCLNFYAGLLMLVMAPMIGFFRDHMGTYNYVFYITGGIVCIIGLLWQFEPMIIKYQNKKLKEKYTMQEKAMIQQLE